MKKLWIMVFVYWAAMGLLVCLLYPTLASDTMSRYAPMADAFARGEWELAFHPRFGVLFQCVAGAFACAGLRGDFACQVTAFLFLSLSAVPIWCLTRRLFDEEIAWWTVAVLLASENFVLNAMDGLRDVSKCLAFALMGLGVVENKSRWFALGLFVLMTVVSYGFAIGSTLVFLWAVFHLTRGGLAKLALPIVGWCAGTTAVTFMVHAFTGHWVPVPFFIKYLGAWL